MDGPHKVNNVEYKNWEFPELNELTKGMEKMLLEHSKTNTESISGLDETEDKINIESIKEAAFQEGILEGIRQEKDRTSKKDSRVEEILQEISNSKESLSKDIEQILINLLSQMLAAIFQLEMKVEVKHLEQAVVESISALEVKDKLYLHFNARTRALLRDSDSELPTINGIEIVEDETLSDSECRIKMDKSFIEIDLFKKLTSAIECLYKEKGA